MRCTLGYPRGPSITMSSQNLQFLTPFPSTLSSFLLSRVYIVNCLWGYPRPPSPLPRRHSLWMAPSRENITVKLKSLCIIALKKSQVKCKKKRLFLYSFHFIHIRRICDFICSSTFKKHQAGLLMYLQKNVNIIMNVETDLLGSVLVNHAIKGVTTVFKNLMFDLTPQ